MAAGSNEESPLLLLAFGAGLIVVAWLKYRYLDQLTYWGQLRRNGPDAAELRRGCAFYVLVLFGVGCMVAAGCQFLAA